MIFSGSRLRRTSCVGSPFTLPGSGHSDDGCLRFKVGRHPEELESRGLWSPHKQVLHINLLELRMIRQVLKADLPFLHSRSVQILTDNMTAIWYVKK